VKREVILASFKLTRNTGSPDRHLNSGPPEQELRVLITRLPFTEHVTGQNTEDKVNVSLHLTKHHAMKTYGRV